MQTNADQPILLNNFQINPVDNREMLICHKHRNLYLVNIETKQVVKEYKSNQAKDEELVYA